MTFHSETPVQTFHPARYGSVLSPGTVRCGLCPHKCVLGDREEGRCLVRSNREGVLVTRAYGQIVTPPARSPIEAKPFYHFLPGAVATTVGTVGCTMACPFCYNWPLIRYRPRTSFLPIDALKEAALAHGSRVVVFAYNEPSLAAEYLLDASPVLHQAGLLVAATTNGFFSGPVRDDLLDALDAVLVDIKDTRPEFYADVLHGDLGTVWSTVAQARHKCHVEIKWVILPSESPVGQAGEIAKRAAGIDPGIPLHIWRYYPHHQWTEPPTDREVLRACREEARNHLHYVYAPESDDPSARNTVCPSCGRLAICRHEEPVRLVGLRADRRCQTCGSSVAVRPE